MTQLLRKRMQDICAGNDIMPDRLLSICSNSVFCIQMATFSIGPQSSFDGVAGFGKIFKRSCRDSLSVSIIGTEVNWVRLDLSNPAYLRDGGKNVTQSMQVAQEDLVSE